MSIKDFAEVRVFVTPPYSPIFTRTCILAFPAEEILISTPRPAHMLFHQASMHPVSASFKVIGWSQTVLCMQKTQSRYLNFPRKVALKKDALDIGQN